MKRTLPQLLLALPLLAIAISGCDGGSGNNPSPSPAPAPATTAIVNLSPPVLSKVINHGLQSNGKFDVELDGSFPGNGYSVAVVCSSATPTAEVLLQTSNQIVALVSSVNDTCHFVVNRGTQASQISQPLVLAGSQTRLAIDHVTPPAPNNAVPGGDVFVIDGTFSGAGDQVYYACDGGAYSAVASVDITLDSANQISFTASAPADFNSCRYYVTDGYVQSPDYNTTVDITDVTYQSSDPLYSDNADFVIAGDFAGYGDQVYESCDGGTYNEVSQTDILVDSGAEISIRTSTPVAYTSCSFYVVSHGIDSPVYTFQ